ncbi:GNAT family N-acetyltransferase [Pseudovibrio exalbescens]|uniref:GNAT family N-acetyltransferase n=1 Tax=Pseudovibrio exalbescens TaxID=197461 RepID=UPI00236700EA|nr:GNAT family N-acetyltransferase [Pseudovibrio exalbescens]MDD7910683.1 GNAT family N-acetyltransferase [Pseudovibrio exalbescens]
MPDENAPALRAISSLREIERAQWDHLANSGARRIPTEFESSSELLESVSEENSYNPFLSWDFLQALEESGCASVDTGWMPHHLILEQQGEVLAAVPAYLKNHSQGEYVFDHAWADAIHRAGGRYYPKIQCSVPFTPVTARKLLVAPEVDQGTARQALVSGLVHLADRYNASSVHLTFMQKPEWDALGELEFLQRTDQQFHWNNNEYRSFEEFLETLASRKRKALRKERREALAHDIEIEWITGSDIKEHHWDAFYAFYMDTGARKWGTPYLNRMFFSLLGERQPEDVLLIMAKRNGRYIAGALNMIGSDTLYGRNWGCIEHHPFLHFEVCYYQAIDFAIHRGLKRVEAGAQGSHKLARGYMPNTTYSAHWIAHPSLRNAVANYLEHERVAVEEDQAYLKERGPFKKHQDNST